MGSLITKLRRSRKPEDSSKSLTQQTPTDKGLFYEDPALNQWLNIYCSDLANESTDAFWTREGLNSGSSCRPPTAERISNELAKLDSQHGKIAYDDRCAGFRVRETLLSGSIADGLASVNIGPLWHTIASDVDIMCVLDLDVELVAGSTSCCAAVIQPSANHEGFFSVRLSNSAPGNLWSVSEGIPLLASSVREKFAKAATSICSSNVAVHGPAVTYHDPNVQLSYDLVPCLTFRWPASWLSEFRDRQRPSGWPGPLLLDQLDGQLSLVPKPAYRGELRLWRMSFSRPEAVLSQNLPPAARFCLLMLRDVRALLGDEVSLIAPYHLKMCVFWLCERQPLGRWKQTVSAMCTVLDALRLFATAGFLPSFLRPSINALNRPNADYRSRLYQQATHFRRRLQPVLEHQLDRLSKNVEQARAESTHQLPPVPWKALSSAGSGKNSKHAVSAAANAGPSALPPRDFYIQDEIMELVPHGILAAAMESVPDDSASVDQARNKMEAFHKHEESFIAGCREL